LKQSEVFLNTLINSIPIPVFYKNRDGQYVGFNKAFETFFGATKEQLVGKTVFDINPPELAKIYHDKDNELFESGGEQHYEAQVKNTFGETRDVIFSKAALTDSKGTVSGLIGAIYDITERKQVEAELLHIKKAVESSSDAIGISDPQGHHIYQNKAFTELFEYTLAEISAAGGGPAVYANKDIAGKVFEAIMSGNSWSGEVEMISRSGRKLPVALHADAIKDESGQIVGLIGVHRDITERKQAEEALLESEERYRFIADHTADHIWTMDLSLRYMYSSPAVIRILGYTIDELMAQKIDQFFTPESLVMAQTVLREELEIEKNPSADPNRIHTFQSEHRHKNGTLVWLESSITIIRDASMKPIGILGVSRDITERKKTEEQIQHLATHDLLTDLPSMRLANDRLSVALNMARRYKKAVAVMFIDLDGFKDVNDELGHDAGDYVLKQVAQRMLSCVRETDTVARVGGDEFLIIATEINAPENVAQIAEKVIHLVSQPIILNGRQAVVSASIGIALFPDDGTNMDQLIKKADEAMYKVKKAGKNGFCFINITVK
jgi:diguanylate cyclase (GGDEF)-like protein/PAS domain S-box-containing protein